MSAQNKNHSSEEVSSSEIFKRLRAYLKHYKLAFFIAILGNLVFAGMDFLFVWSLEPLTNKALVKNDMSTIEAAPYFIIILLIIRGVASFISAYCMSWVGQNIVQKIQIEMAQKFVNLPSKFFDQVPSGRLISKMTFDTQQIATATTDTFTKLLREGGVIIFILIYIFYTSWQLASLFLISAPLIGLIVSFASKRFKIISRNIQDAMGGVTQKTQEIVEGYKVIKTFNGESFEISKFTLEAQQTRNQNIKMVATKAFSTPVIQLIAGISLSLVLYFAGQQLASGELEPGEFVAMLGMMIMMLKPLKVVSNLNSVLQKGIAAAKSIFEILDEPTETDDGKKTIDSPVGNIEFKDVSFSYSKTLPKVISNISFKVNAGETVAFVGKSGSGKSTITNLLLRFYNPNNGEIILDDTNTNELSLENLRSHISIVSQQVILFNTSIAKNIGYPNDKELDMQRVKNASIKAHAWEFIKKLEHGLEEEIGENGNRLSGGQRQRIAIARALYKNSPIVILDEATSALDTESERHIQAALESLSINRTTIVIAHRLSTIEKADTIIVLNDGNIVESGSHRELIERSGAYTKLYQMQFAEQESNQ